MLNCPLTSTEEGGQRTEAIGPVLRWPQPMGQKEAAPFSSRPKEAAFPFSVPWDAWASSPAGTPLA